MKRWFSPEKVSINYRRLPTRFLLSLLPLLYLQGICLLNAVPFTLSGLLVQWIFIISVILLARSGSPELSAQGKWLIGWKVAVLIGLGLLAGLAYTVSAGTISAWITLVFIYAALLVSARILTRGKKLLISIPLVIIMAMLGGAAPVVMAQVEGRFSEEEFFGAVQAIAMAILWLLLYFTWRWAGMPEGSPADFNSAAEQNRGRLAIQSWVLAVCLILLVITGGALAIRSYQHSFYPPEAPTYTNISYENPFLCGQTAADPTTYESQQVFQEIMTSVAALPRKETIDLALLAMALDDATWAGEFRQALLEEAEQGKFAQPANSLKSIQYEAALRAYFYVKTREAFPELFSAEDQEKIREWFISINQRALSVEWVDWMYALAFSKLPEGPYENQENGAGLLALIESQDIIHSDSPKDLSQQLSSRNQDYLRRNPRGWEERFHNTDDAFVYQPLWIDNALFQSLYTGQAPEENVRKSFEWILLQALPDGALPGYNHPIPSLLIGPAYLAADMLQDSRYLWLVGRTLDYIKANPWPITARPGMEKPLDMVGQSPTTGSCLIYADSGLPNQVGPLAPDKIVFRDGWSKDSAYLMLNLRFTGWHRYKATNTVTLFYQSGPLVVENVNRDNYPWLPAGRSMFRDKRIPRENLNGLVIEKTGMSKVLYTLTGMGGPWAQDPPFYARVRNFSTGEEFDTSQTTLENWHNWEHRRTTYFYHQGPVIVFDQAHGPANQEAALIWHITAGVTPPAQTGSELRYAMRQGGEPAEMLLLPLEYSNASSKVEGTQKDIPILNIQISSQRGGDLALVSLFLTREWVGAQAEVQQTAEGWTLMVTKDSQRISLPLGQEGQ